MDAEVAVAAYEAVRHHLREAGVEIREKSGQFSFGDSRLELEIAFEGYHEQGKLMLAPLEIGIQVDGDASDRFRAGVVGVGADSDAALREAIAQWHVLALAPVLAALGAVVDNRRAQPQRLAQWDLFPGRVYVRGPVPGALRSDGDFYRALRNQLRETASSLPPAAGGPLRSMFIMATRSADGCEIQAAVDGQLDPDLIARLNQLPWPAAEEPYLYKQLFVLRASS